MITAKNTNATDGPTTALRAYEKPGLTEHGSLAVRTAGQPGLVADAIIQIDAISL